jgi:basic membrane protein A
MKYRPKFIITIFLTAALMVGLVIAPEMAQAASKGKVALVSDVGGRGDLSFNDMSFKGTEKAAADFGLEMVGIQSGTAADYLSQIGFV